jgi:peptidoglycan/xylan/chitin deacetylase (PgdA/CDA1 family)
MVDRHFIKKNITCIYSALTYLQRNKMAPRVLMYHSVLNSVISNNMWEIEYAKFSRHIDYLINSDRVFIKCSDIFEKIILNPVAITFDDGSRSVYENAVPLLIQKKIPSTIFITKNYIKGCSSNYLTPEMIKELSNNNLVSIGSHGVSHDDLSKKSTSQIIAELIDSKKYLEDLTGKEVNLFSYPHGRVFKNSQEILSDSGYICAFNSKMGVVTKYSNSFLIPRVEIWGGDEIKDFEQKIQGCWDWLGYLN